MNAPLSTYRIAMGPNAGRLPALTAGKIAIRALIGVGCALVAGCNGTHSALNPAGPQAAHITGLWRIFLSVGAVIWLLVMAFVIAALVRNRASDSDFPGVVDAGLKMSVIIAITATVTTLFVLLLLDFRTNRSLGPPDAPNAITIKLTGRQWWWLAEYQDPVASNVIQVANELHLPTGTPILFQLQSPDVIHSFWVPGLQGKKDLIPGRPTSLWLQADRPGTYEGQCAEFCGYQHAHMGLTIVAESREKYDAWKQAQLKTPPPPSTDEQKRGQQIFLTGSCVLCHAIEGTPARSHVGPALTHLASQRTIAANTVPKTRDNLRRWIVDPHTIKPGVHMPQNSLSGGDLEALLDYLETLQ